MIEISSEFAARMKYLLGSEYTKFEEALGEPAVKAFRVNTEKITLSDFEKINIFGNEHIPYVSNGFYLEYDKVGNHPYHHAGMIYVQDAGAMSPAECIDVEPDWKILDMCAAPGGKSSQFRNKLGENGLLVSNELIPSRCKLLTGNIERLGFKNTITTCLDTAKLAKMFPSTFDLAVVDAPCSGEGMFRKGEAALREWSAEKVIGCAERQSEILDRAATVVKDGGYILYSTCTYSLEENEMTVDAFLSRHPDFELVPVNQAVRACTSDGIFFDGCKCDNIEFTRRFYPHISRGEGQFMAVLKNMRPKRNDAVKPRNCSSKADQQVLRFLSETLENADCLSVTEYNGNPIIYSSDLTLAKGAAFCCGVTIGEKLNNCIRPHHQFFSAMGKSFKLQIELSPDSAEMTKYLHGEEFLTDCRNGWAVVTTQGCPIGGVKVVNGVAKNHYPKGLRRA